MKILVTWLKNGLKTLIDISPKTDENVRMYTSLALIIRKIQMKIRMRYHFIPFRMTIKKKKQKTSVVEHVEKLELLYTTGENTKWNSYCGK